MRKGLFILLISALLVLFCSIKHDNPFDPLSPDYVPPQLAFDSSLSTVVAGDTLQCDTVVIVFWGNEDVNVFRARLDSLPWSAWSSTSKYTFKQIPNGKHVFRIATRYADGEDVVEDSVAFVVKVSEKFIAPVASKSISVNPVNKGQSVSITAAVNDDANPLPVFRWIKEGDTNTVSASQIFVIPQADYSDSGRYRYIVSNSQGRDSSNWITLLINDITKPVITLKGANPQKILIGSTFSELGFSASDDKDGIITSRVIVDTTHVNTGALGGDTVYYSVKDNAGNSADVVRRIIQVYGVAPTVTISASQEVCIGTQAVFKVVASGTPTPKTFKWMKAGTVPTAAPGINSDSVYKITPNSEADAGDYFCTVSNGIEPDAKSQNVSLIVDSPPRISAITVTPSSMPVCPGEPISFKVVATGSGTLRYIWKRDGKIIENATNPTYTISAVTTMDSGQYSCSVSNNCTPSANSANVQLSIKAPPIITSPTLDSTISIWAGDSLTLAVAATGTGSLQYQWYKGNSTFGTNSFSFSLNPVTLTNAGSYTCAVSNGCSPVNSKAFVLGIKSIVKVAGRGNHTLLLMNDSTLWACGSNSCGQLGDGTTTSRVSPIRVMSNVRSMAAGSSHSLILQNDGTLWACGSNSYGQLGDNNLVFSRPTLKVMATNVKSVAAGDNHTLILKEDNTLWACGLNGNGQLGDSTTTNRSSIVKVMSNVQSMAGGAFYSLILTTDGTLWACGDNSSGQFGNGTTLSDSIPVRVMPHIQNIAVGSKHSLILQSDGKLLACGSNSSGQLGVAAVTSDSIPFEVMQNVQDVATGNSHSLILKTDGTLWACGWNGYGQLGDGTTVSSTTPIRIMAGTIIKNVTACGAQSYCLKQDGTTWACGYNDYGQLGDGTIIARSTPVRIKF